MASTIERPVAPEAGTPSGGPNLREEDLHQPGTLLFLLGGAAVVAVLVGLVAFDIGPFDGERGAYLAGFLAVLVLHAGLAATVAGLVIEWRHPGWTYFGEGQHLVLLVCALCLAALTGGLWWWLIDQSISTMPLIGVAVASGLGLCVGAAYAYLVGSRRREDLEVGLVRFGATVVGAILAAVVIVTAVVGAAYVRNRQVASVPDPPVIHGIKGTYVALGDSYSAGEGLAPFDPYTGSPSADQGDGCHRSNQAYPAWLTFDPPLPSERFVACSGAVTVDATTGYVVTEANHAAIDVAAQIGAQDPGVGLVTLTMGGNDLLYSKVVLHCLADADCLDTGFAPPTVQHRTFDAPPAQLLRTWAAAALGLLRPHLADLYQRLRAQYPNARIVVLGYPYLVPAGGAGVRLDDCMTVLRRLSQHERDQLRLLQDQFNDLLYEQASGAGVEFVSPAAVWDGHEPCGQKAQYTNAIKPVFSKDLVDGGSFHPNAAGQKALAGVVACYLDTNPTPPNPFVGGVRHPIDVEGLVPPADVGLQPVPGSLGHPVTC